MSVSVCVRARAHTHTHTHTHTQEMLVQRLHATEAVLRRVTSERDKLINISNMLRADLKRAQVSY